MKEKLVKSKTLQKQKEFMKVRKNKNKKLI